MRLTIVGSGRVGLTTALAMEHLGTQVTCVDLSQEIVDALYRRTMPFHDPSLERLLATSQMSVLSEMTAEAASADVVMICVQTPGLPDGHADLSRVFAVAEQVASLVPAGADLVLAVKSTSPPGSAAAVRELVDKRLKERGVDAVISVASNPEFLAQGSALADTLYPGRIVIGVDDETAEKRLYALHSRILEQTFEAPEGCLKPDYVEPRWVSTTPVNAELIKYGSNAFLSTKLTFVNELARLAQSLGGDITDVVRGIGMDPRIGAQYMQAGPGLAGPCLGKDTRALAAVGDDIGEETPLLGAIAGSNEVQRRSIVDRIESSLGSLDGTTVGILGLSFKAGTDDVTDSAALDVAKLLVERGASVRAHDPAAEERAKRALPEFPIAYRDDADEMSDGCDAVVLMTDWPDFRSLDWQGIKERMKGQVVFDARNFLDRDDLEAAGFRYLGLGR